MVVVDSVTQILEKIAKEQDISWGRVTVKEASPQDLSYLYASYYSWDGCAGTELSTTRYWVVGKKGWQEVPYRYYSQEYASSLDQDIREEEDVYVGDYISDDTVMVIRRDRSYVDVEGRDYENKVETTVYILRHVNLQQLREEIKRKIDELPLDRLLTLAVRYL